MLRRLALLLLPLSLALAWSLGCGGTKNFTFDAGSIDAGPGDAGPCDPYTNTNCPSNAKCTIVPDGGPICGAVGSGDNYADCTDDSNCKGTTACVDLEFSGFLSGKHCYPFCDLSKQDAGSTCPSASSGATCLNLHTIPEGFCDLPADGG